MAHASHAQPSLKSVLAGGVAFCAILASAAALDATWLASPPNSNWNNGANWTGGVVPTGTATFGMTNRPQVDLPFATAIEIGTIHFANPSGDIHIGGGMGIDGPYSYGELHFTGAGVVNDTSERKYIYASTDKFYNSSSAGQNIWMLAQNVEFHDSSTAGDAYIWGYPSALNIMFYDMSNPGTATLDFVGQDRFALFQTAYSATAGQPRIIMAGTRLDLSNTPGSAIQLGSIETEWFNSTVAYLGIGGRTLTVGGNNLSTRYDGYICDQAICYIYAQHEGGIGTLNKVGTGTLELNGQTLVHNVTVSSGTVALGVHRLAATIGGDVLVNAGGTLSGQGTITGTLSNHGTVAMDASMAGFKVGGYVQGSDGTLEYGIEHDRWPWLNVSGTANLNGNLVLDLTGAGPYQTLVLLTADNISGTFSHVTLNGGGSSNYVIGYLPNSVRLTLLTLPAVPVDSAFNAETTTYMAANGTTLLAVTPDVSPRAITLNGVVSIDTVNSPLALGGPIDGTGSLTMFGGEMVILTGNNTYTGGTIISDVGLYIGHGGTTGSIVGDVVDNGMLSFQRYDNVFFGGAISGIGSLYQLGSGVLYLTGSNTYTGGTGIFSGALSVGDGGTTGSIVGNVRNEALLLFYRTDASIFGGDISGTGKVYQYGSGITYLTGNNTYTGGTVVTHGVLSVGDGGTTGSITGDVVNDGLLLFYRTNSSIFGGAISGSGRVYQLGSGTTYLTGNSTYTGGTTISAGTLQLGTGGTSGSITGDVIDNGTLAFNRSDNVVFGGAISGSGSLVRYGTNVLTLTGDNTYTGGTTIAAGTLQLGNGGTSGSIVGNVVDNGTLAFNRSDNIFFGGTISGSGSLVQSGGGVLYLTGSNTYSGGTTISSGVLSVGDGGTIGSIAGNVVDNGVLLFYRTDANFFGGNIFGSGKVYQYGSGITYLTGSNTYTGGTVVTHGILSVGDGGTTGSITGDVANDGWLLFYRTNASSFGGAISGSGRVYQLGTGTTTFTGNSTYTGDTIISAGTLQLGNGGTSGSITSNVIDNGALAFNRADTVVFGGTISGSGSLVQSGSGKTSLTGDNTYTGGTTITAGTLQLGNGGTSGSILGNVVDNGTLAFNRSDNIFFGGTISGSGSLVQSGSGVLYLTGSNTYSGGTTVSSGVLSVGDGGTIGSITGNVVNNGLLLFYRTDAVSFGGSISGTGRVYQLGTGTTSLTGNSTYSGGTVISAGTLEIKNNNALGTGNVSLAGGNLLLDNGIDLTNNVNIQSLSLMTVDAGNTATISGALIGSAPFQKNGTGTLILNHDNRPTYSGDISFHGTLIAGVTGAFGTGTVTVIGSSLQLADGMTYTNPTVLLDDLTVTQDGSFATISGTISESGAHWGINKLGTGTVILTGANTYTGGTTISAGTLQIGNGGTTGSILGNVTNRGALIVNHGTLAFNRSDTVSFMDIVYGGNLIQRGPGTLILNNDAYANVNVSGGTLIVGDSAHGSVVIDGSANVASGATLGGFGRIAGAVTNGGTVAPGASIGTLTVGSYTQPSGGTLAIEMTPTANDVLNVTGAASLNGTLALSLAQGSYGTSDRTFLSAGSLSGTFSTVTISGGDDLAKGVRYTANAANLVTEPKREADLYSGFYRQTLGQAETISDLVFTHMQTAYCADVDAAAGNQPACPEVSVWYQGFGSIGAMDAAGEARAFNSRAAGLIGGFDYRFDDGTAFGVAGAFSEGSLNREGGSGKISSSTFALALSGGTPLLGGRIDLDLQYLLVNGKSTREITPNAMAMQTATAHPKAKVLSGAAQYEHPVLVEGLDAFARLSYSRVSLQSFSESGTSVFDFALPSQGKSTAYADLGLRFSKAFKMRTGSIIVPEISGAVRTDLTGNTMDVSANLADASGTSFVAPGPSRDTASFLLGVGVTAENRNGFQLYFRGHGRFSSGAREGVISLGSRYTF